MENNSIIVGAIVLICAILPFLLLGREEKKQNKKRLQEFNQFVKENSGNIARIEKWKDRVLGHDRYSDRVFYFFSNSEFTRKEIIDLSKISKLEVEKSYREIDLSEGKVKIVNRVELIFHGRDSRNFSIDFYTNDYDEKALNGEIQLAEKWCKLIQNDIK